MRGSYQRWGTPAPTSPSVRSYVKIMNNLNLTLEDISKPNFIRCSISDIWKTINSCNPYELKFRLNRLNYRDYLRTPYWYALASTIKTKAQMRCQLCNSKKEIQVHHRTYKHKGEEHRHMNDLVCLCDKCHGGFHRKFKR